MDENLLGYLLNALDAAERRAVESRLAATPRDGRRWPAPAPRPGPAGRRRRAAGAAARPGRADPGPRRRDRCRRLPAAAAAVARTRRGPAGGAGRRADLLVAAALLVLVGGLCVPRLVRQWRRTTPQSCPNNLPQFWRSAAGATATTTTASSRGLRGRGPRSVAGIFVPVLHEAGVLPSDVSVACPAERPRAPLGRHRSPTWRDAPYRRPRAEYDARGPRAGAAATPTRWATTRTAPRLRPAPGLRRPACRSWPTAVPAGPATAPTTAAPARTSCTSAATSAGAPSATSASAATTSTSTSTTRCWPAWAARHRPRLQRRFPRPPRRLRSFRA